MASYGLKYYAEWRNYRKHDYRLEVLRRGYSGSAKAMGDFAGCILEVQGSQGDIIAPIVKTQLRFTLIDTYDEPDTGSVKHGDWQEFYTPDAGLYKVVLKAWDSGAWVTEWSGYITPDSWAENLDYRTGVTITARDNIGHLQDFSFDMTPNSDGLVKISDLIDRAMEICELAMDYTIARSGLGPSSLNSIVADGVYLHDAYINASIFEGGNWYDALEKTLEAIGMALRYVGNNSVEITYLRNLPYMGNPYAQAGYQELEFYGGTLELDPAVKEIEEVVEYDHEPTISMDLSSGVTLGAEQTYLCKITGSGRGFTFNGGEHDAPYNVLSSRGESNISNLTDGLLDVSGRSPVEDLIKNEGESWSEYTFVPANVQGDNGPMLVLFANVIGTKAVINLRFNRSALTLRWVNGTEYKLADLGFSLEKIQYSVSYGRGSSICYWDGKGWASQTEPFKIDQEYDWKNEFGEELEIKLTPCDALTGGLPLRITIWHIDYKVTQRPPDVPLIGVYARLQSATISVDSIALKGDRVLTVNNSSFNVRIDRKPIIGALSRTMEFVVPANYGRAIYYYKDGALTMYPYLVRFDGQASGREVPLPVLIHEQILCYYHGAARVLQGNCAPINKVRLDFHNRFRYKNTYYLLQGGSLDMFSGIVTGGIFREYAMFDDLWSQSPSWSNKPILDGDSYTPSGGGSGGGGGITTETDPVFNASPAAGITKADIDKWNSSAGGGSVVKVTNYSTAVAASLLAIIEVDGVGTAIYNDVRWGTYDSTTKTIPVTINGTTRVLCVDGYASGGGGGSYTLPAATAAALGGVRIGYEQTGKNYPVLLDGNNRAYVNVPWEASSIESLSRKAPRIQIYRGFNKYEQYAFAPYLLAEHPAIGTVTDAEFVLMMMSPRRARRTGHKLCKARKGWGAALGKTGEGGLTFSRWVTLLDLRTYILQNYVSVFGQDTSSMTYATYQSLRLATGFGYPTGTEERYRKKVTRSRVFGIAVRWTNPEFRELASGTLSDHTTAIYENGKYIPRWIYSDVAPIRVSAKVGQLDRTTHTGGVIGFQLLP